MKNRPVRIQELSLVMLKEERDEIGQDAPVHVVRQLSWGEKTSATACGHHGPMQLFLPFLWFLTKAPNACKKCMTKTVEQLDPRDMPQGLSNGP